MSLDVIRLLVDFGFVVFIWTVQLVIYPSFKFYSNPNLITWHKRYTGRVTVIVLPLMFSQLILSSFQLWQELNWYTVFSSLIIVSLWLQTFLIFVPLHQRIDDNTANDNVCTQLVLKNWMRTLLWTFLFFISLWHYLLIS